MEPTVPAEDQLISQVTERLEVMLPARSTREIQELVSALLRSYDGTPVRDFLPILVEREALDILWRRRAHVVA